MRRRASRCGRMPQRILQRLFGSSVPFGAGRCWVSGGFDIGTGGLGEAGVGREKVSGRISSAAAAAT